jgi:hypothetical protein
MNSFADKEGFDLKRNTDEDDKKKTGNLTPYETQRERERVKDFITGQCN